MTWKMQSKWQKVILGIQEAFTSDPKWMTIQNIHTIACMRTRTSIPTIQAIGIQMDSQWFQNFEKWTKHVENDLKIAIKVTEKDSKYSRSFKTRPKMAEHTKYMHHSLHAHLNQHSRQTWKWYFNWLQLIPKLWKIDETCREIPEKCSRSEKKWL